MSEPALYRKRPVEIEALQFDGGNEEDILNWMSEEGSPEHVYMMADGRLAIETLEGTLLAAPGDWVIRGVGGEWYPCKPDIFEATYEAAAASRPSTTEEGET